MQRLWIIESEAHYINGNRPVAFGVAYPTRELAVDAAKAVAEAYYSGDGFVSATTEVVDEDTWHGERTRVTRRAKFKWVHEVTKPERREVVVDGEKYYREVQVHTTETTEGDRCMAVYVVPARLLYEPGADLLKLED